MPDQTAIDSALLTLANAEFGAGKVELAVDFEVAPGKGVLVFNGYATTELDFRQQRIAYTYILLFSEKAGSDSNAVRDTVSDHLEAIRDALPTDAPLAALVHDARVVGLLVSSGPNGPVQGAMEIVAEVIR